MVYVEAIDWMVKFFVRFTTTDNAPKSLPQFGLNNDLLANSNALWQGREQLGYITRLSRLCWYSGRLERDASETHELGSGTQQLNLYVRPQCWIFELLNKAGFSTSGAVTCMFSTFYNTVLPLICFVKIFLAISTLSVFWNVVDNYYLTFALQHSKLLSHIK